MLKRLLLTGLITSAIQVLLYYILLTLLQSLQPSLHDLNSSYLVSAENTMLATYFFIYIVSIQNILAALINNARFTWVALGISAIAFLLYWTKDLHTVSLTLILFLLAGIIALLSKFIIMKQVAKWE